MLRHSLLALALLGNGCSIERVLLDGQLAATRKASTSFDTLSDLEVAKIGAGSSLVQLEGMHVLAPDQQDALFLLLNGYTGFASAFVEDEWEQAYDRGDDDAEAAFAERAKKNYDRALMYGTELIETKYPGFQAAQRNRDTIKAYLQRRMPGLRVLLLDFPLAGETLRLSPRIPIMSTADRRAAR